MTVLDRFGHARRLHAHVNHAGRAANYRNGEPIAAEDLPAFVLTALLLLLACILGGSSRPGLAGDTLLQLASLPVLWLALARLRWASLAAPARLALIWLGLVGALFALQCLPLPHDWWVALGGRAELAAELVIAGVDPSVRPLSLDAYATERALWTLLPPAAVFIGALSLDPRTRLRLVPVLFGMVALSVVLGLAQVADGPDSGLRLYAITNPTEAVGFFANRNHYAALLYMSLPLALAWLAARLAERSAGRAVSILGIVADALLVMLVILGLVLARSRAGLILGMAGLLAGVVIALSIARIHDGGHARITRGVVATAVMGLVLAIQYGLYGVLERLGQDPLGDARWTVLGVTLQAARHFGALGSGYGTFVNAYQSFETPAVQFSAYVNHAHNDWAELWLEGGWPAAVLAALLLLWLLFAGVRVWRRRGGSPMAAVIPRAASVSIVLCLLQETVDYSLRTSADLCVLALLCALLVRRPAARDDADRAASARRTSTVASSATSTSSA